MPKNVSILTGFLGAGKTTFLNALMAENPTVKYAIIENEFGETGIDGELIISPNDSIVEMNNGCLCCSLNDDLFDILNELKERFTDFDELIIETTGIADPANVAVSFLTDPNLKKDFTLKSVICIVDAQQIEQQLIRTEEAIKQIVFSDVLVLNKGIGDNKKIKATLEKLNPFAKIFEAKDLTFPIQEITKIWRDADFKVGGETKAIHHHGHHHHGDIESISFEFNKPFDAQKFQMSLYGYLVFHAVDLYRIKGIMHAHDVPHRLVVQSVGQNLSVIGGKKWEANEEKLSKIVFIGKKLPKEQLKTLLDEALWG